MRAFRAGDIARARDVHYRLLPLIDALFCETNPIPVKAALAHARPACREEIRLPLTTLTHGEPRAPAGRAEGAGPRSDARAARACSSSAPAAAWASACARRSRRSRRCGSAAALEAPGHPQLGTKLGAGRASARRRRRPRSRDGDVGDRLLDPAATLPCCAPPPSAGVAYVMRDDRASRRGERARDLALAARRIPIVHAPNFSVVGERARASRARGRAPARTRLRRRDRRAAPRREARRAERHGAARWPRPSPRARGAAARRAMLVLEREGETGARPAGAIGIQALRGGDNRRRAQRALRGRGRAPRAGASRADARSLRRGAVRAARWLAGREPGLYRVEQVLGLESLRRRAVPARAATAARRSVRPAIRCRSRARTRAGAGAGAPGSTSFASCTRSRSRSDPAVNTSPLSRNSWSASRLLERLVEAARHRRHPSSPRPTARRCSCPAARPDRSCSRSRRCPAISIAANARYGLQVGSGKRTSMRFAFGLGE